MHDGHPVRQDERLLLVMGHVQDGEAERPLDPFDLELHLIAQLPVEGAEWLIHQEHRRPEHEGPGQGDSLLLAAAELLDPTVAERSQLHKG